MQQQTSKLLLKSYYCTNKKYMHTTMGIGDHTEQRGTKPNLGWLRLRKMKVRDRIAYCRPICH